MEVHFVEAKKILTRNKHPEQWFGVQYGMNIYRGCSHGCIYCDSRSECYQIENFEDLTVKRNAIDLLKKELSTKRNTISIGFGAMSDPYHPAEETLLLTQQALTVIKQFRMPLHICTKSDLILRDLKILNDIKMMGLSVGITLTTVDPYIASRIEPGAPSPQARLKALKTLSDAGIYVGILMMPILPFVDDAPEQIEQLVEASAVNGAKFIVPSYSVTLRDRQRAYFYAQLDKTWPGLSEKYRKTFGNAYGCTSPNVKTLSQIVKGLCSKNQIAYGMKNVKSIKPKIQESMQLSFFNDDNQ